MFGCLSEDSSVSLSVSLPFLEGQLCTFRQTTHAVTEPMRLLLLSALGIYYVKRSANMEKKTLFRVNPMISQPSLASAFPLSFPSLAPRSVIRPVNHPAGEGRSCGELLSCRGCWRPAGWIALATHDGIFDKCLQDSMGIFCPGGL